MWKWLKVQRRHLLHLVSDWLRFPLRYWTKKTLMRITCAFKQLRRATNNTTSFCSVTVTWESCKKTDQRQTMSQSYDMNSQVEAFAQWQKHVDPRLFSLISNFMLHSWKTVPLETANSDTSYKQNKQTFVVGIHRRWMANAATIEAYSAYSEHCQSAELRLCPSQGSICYTTDSACLLATCQDNVEVGLAKKNTQRFSTRQRKHRMQHPLMYGLYGIVWWPYTLIPCPKSDRNTRCVPGNLPALLLRQKRRCPCACLSQECQNLREHTLICYNTLYMCI